MQILEVPTPWLGPGTVLVQNHYSLISAGTEASTVKAARKSYIGKAKERPQQVKQVLDSLREKGPVQTYRAVMKKLDAHSPLGYSCVGKVVDALPDTRLGRHIAGQLVRCSTSPAANYEEACAGESRADFLHKLSICLKELRESRFWIRLIVKTDLLSDKKMANLLDECLQLCKILAQSIVTAKNKRSENR